jgi:hypothetical protein
MPRCGERQYNIARMLSDFQQREVWENWLAAEMRANYFADLCGRFQRQHSRLTWATLVFSSSAAFSFLSSLPNLGKALLALVVAGLSIYSIVQQNLRKISECSDLSFRWNTLAIQYSELWNNVYAQDAPSKLHDLLEKGAQISKSAQTLPNDEKTMLKWEEHVLKHHIPNYSSPATA